METTEKTTEQMEDDVKTALVVMKEEGALTVIDQSKALVVSDRKSKERSISCQKRAKGLIKEYEVIFGPLKGEFKARHQNACDKEKEFLLPLKEVVANESNKVATFNQAETDRLKKEAQERADIEAAERAERLQAIQASINERVVQSTSSADTIELLNLMLLEADMTDEKAGLIRSQITTEQAVLDGVNRAAAEEAAKAEMVASAPPPPPAASMAPKSKGEVQGFKYEVTVVDMKALCKAIGEGKVLPAAVKMAQGNLNKYARDGAELEKYGCHIDKKPSSHTTSA